MTPAIIRVCRLEVLKLVMVLSLVIRWGPVGPHSPTRGNEFSEWGHFCYRPPGLRRIDEDRRLPRHSGHHGRDLVGTSDQPGLQLGFQCERSRGVIAYPRLVVETLRRADRVR